MAKEAFDMHTASLEMKGGLEADVKYPAKYHEVPKSLLPKNYGRSEDMSVPSNVMRCTLGRK